MDAEKPFLRIPYVVLRHPDLTVLDKLVYGEILHAYYAAGYTHPEIVICHINVEKIVVSLGTSEKGIKRSIRRLLGMGLICKEGINEYEPGRGKKRGFYITRLEDVFSTAYIKAAQNQKMPRDWRERWSGKTMKQGAAKNNSSSNSSGNSSWSEDDIGF